MFFCSFKRFSVAHPRKARLASAVHTDGQCSRRDFRRYKFGRSYVLRRLFLLHLARRAFFFEFFDTHFFKRLVFPKVEFFKFVQLFFERVTVGKTVIDKRLHSAFFVADTAFIYLLGISVRFLNNRVKLNIFGLTIFLFFP